MLDNIRQQFVRLVSAYETEKAARCSLEQRNRELADQCEAYREQIAELEKKYDNLRLTEAFVGGTADSSGPKQKIESIIREIDKCISLI